jgi:dTDP-glucose pyrophosphorylase
MDCTLPTSAVLRDAVHVIEASKTTLAVVIEADGRIFGTISDGDVRRALLAGCVLDVSVVEVANRKPLTATSELPETYLKKLLLASGLEALPIVDDLGRFLKLVRLAQFEDPEAARVPNPFWAAVIMAGGEGQRLRPLTEATPKPMIEVGGMPLLERQIVSLKRAGISRVFVAINYLGHLIERHFGDGSTFGVEISYLREPQKMGTGGALSLLPRPVEGDLLVMNGDILTRSDFKRLGYFHREHGATITVCATQYDVHIPFGVLVADGARVTALKEKPSQRFLCNAGIYALSANIISLISNNTYLDMTDLIGLAIRDGQRVMAFPIYEFWSDIGTARDLEIARRSINQVE